MPRALKSDKFFLYAPERYGRYKGRMLLGVNRQEGELSVQDLLDFLKQKGIDPAKVPLLPPFVVYVKP